MKRILLTIMVIVAGLSAIAPDINAQSGKSNARAATKQEKMDAWERDMAEFRARSAHDREIRAIADSIASVQARAALKNQDFVLEIDNITTRSGANLFVNSTTNFISVKGNKAVVQISPSNFASGPNGVGGVTVEGMISDQLISRDKKGRITYSFSVMGIGINAQIEVYLSPDSNDATATIYPNFNSNTIWVEGSIVPYDNSRVFEGMSL